MDVSVYMDMYMDGWLMVSYDAEFLEPLTR